MSPSSFQPHDAANAAAARFLDTVGRVLPSAVRTRAATPSLTDWCELLALVLRARFRRILGRRGIISPERQIAAVEADLLVFERLRAMAMPLRS